MTPNDNDDLFDELEGDFFSEEQGANPEVEASEQSAPVAQPPEATDDNWLEEEDTEAPGQLAVDVYQTKENIVVVAPVPGVSKADLDLSIVESTLTVRGSRKQDQNVRKSDYFVQECYWGEFSRSIILPVQVKEEEAQAELKDGMLTVTISKAEQDKVKKINIT